MLLPYTNHLRRNLSSIFMKSFSFVSVKNMPADHVIETTLPIIDNVETVGCEEWVFLVCHMGTEINVFSC